MVGWIVDGVNSAITGFFKGLVTEALNPLLELLGKTLLSTPTLEQLPRVGELWTNSWQIMLACYGILIMIAGVVVMAHQSVQAHFSAKEAAPRIILGFLASALSLFVANEAIALANALSRALLGQGVDEEDAALVLEELIMDAINDGIFVILLGVLTAVMLLAVLITYAVRVALTVTLIAGAPLALMCHALPQTDGIARWWWKCFGSLLAIQIAQSLVLITALRLFLDPDGFILIGSNRTGLVNLIVCLALMYILFKIPFWLLGSLRSSHRRSFAGSLARTYVAAKTFGVLRGMTRSTAAGAAPRTRAWRNNASAPSSGSAQSNTSTTAPGAPRHAGRVGRRPPGPALFREPVPGAAPRFGPAIGPPDMPVFRPPATSPGEGSSASSSPPSPRPTEPPGPPTFRQPGPTTSPPARHTGPAEAPGRPHFRPPTRHAPTPPRRASGPPPPSAFRPPVPEPDAPPSRRRTSAPPPPTFRSPPPARTPPTRQRPGRSAGGDRR
ncbi:hypothetical protein ACWGJ2_01115 [Streptomyces sp. NPDC054796]